MCSSASKSAPIRAPPPRRNACVPAASITTLKTSALPSATTRSSRCLAISRSEEHTSELQSPYDLVCRLLLEKQKQGARRVGSLPLSPDSPSELTNAIGNLSSCPRG